MKVIVAGSRTITDYKTVKNAIEYSGFKITEIVSGGAQGVDKLGEKWARLHNVKIKMFQANWKEHGRKAGVLRNIEMLKYIGSDGGLVAVWDGVSRGTDHMINIAIKKTVEVYIDNRGEHKSIHIKNIHVEKNNDRTRT